tara:strand:+ start:7180 stop:7932 length:753 start_codon:yes stop_codon:yes gene_type:complete
MDTQKNILIGGITGGIGHALAEQLIGDQHNVFGFARNEAGLQSLQETLPSAGSYCADATDPNQLADAFKEAADSMGSIDAYVHAIGSIIIKPAHLTSDQDWQNTLGQNLSSAFYALKEAVKVMQRQNKGSVVFFSSTAAQIGIANHEAIAASKGGIEAMVRSAAATYSSRKIRFNSIAPGLTDTGLAKPITSNPQALEISKKMCPLNAIAAPQDIASLAKWLISDSAQFVTGQCFTVDGGLSSTTPKPRA